MWTIHLEGLVPFFLKKHPQTKLMKLFHHGKRDLVLELVVGQCSECHFYDIPTPHSNREKGAKEEAEERITTKKTDQTGICVCSICPQKRFLSRRTSYL